MYNLTPEFLNSLCPQGNITLMASLSPFLNKWLPQYQITTILRISNFLGQAAQETAYFRTLTEYASGREYEGRQDLGNVYQGDGERFRGRGIFQITGRANYTKADVQLDLGTQLIDNPQLAADPEISVRTACEYWNARNMNAWADQNNIHQITRLINGGYNGLAVRTSLTNKANQLLCQMAETIVPPVILVQAPVMVPPQPQQSPENPLDIIENFVKNTFEQAQALKFMPAFGKEGQ